jgi:triosephosphate isomerase
VDSGDKKHDPGKSEVIVLPPFTDLRTVQTLVDGDRLEIGYGAQDMSAFDNGAYTGDISAGMLVKLGCRYVVVGHSERRRFHGEDDNIVNAKTLKAVSRHGSDRLRRRGLSIRQSYARCPTLPRGRPGRPTQSKLQPGHRVRARLGDRH